ncbi:MAG TPA: metalloregulator ArsR/SmtB family transcription factor [bacterium]
MKLNKIFEIHAEICKTLANAKRLEILDALRGSEITVNGLVKKVGIRKANISQHLAVLRIQGVVIARRAGRNIYYKISNPKIIRACNLMREVLMERIKRERRLWSKFEKTGDKG